jgi:hypothetical protein
MVHLYFTKPISQLPITRCCFFFSLYIYIYFFFFKFVILLYRNDFLTSRSLIFIFQNYYYICMAYVYLTIVVTICVRVPDPNRVETCLHKYTI